MSSVATPETLWLAELSQTLAGLRPLMDAICEGGFGVADMPVDRFYVLSPREKHKWCQLGLYSGHTRYEDAAQTVKSMHIYIPFSPAAWSDESFFDCILSLIDLGESVLQVSFMHLNLDRAGSGAVDLIHSLLYVGFFIDTSDQTTSNTQYYTLKYEFVK